MSIIEDDQDNTESNNDHVFAFMKEKVFKQDIIVYKCHYELSV